MKPNIRDTIGKPAGLPEVIENRYHFKEVLGQGGMAIVYKVNDIVRKQDIALKLPMIKKEGRLREETERLFENEFHTLAQLAHPRVVQVFDYGSFNSVPFYTMELLSGGDLKSLSPLPWKNACSILRDICSVLTLLHSRKQIHRDLTTRNVLCTLDGKAKLFDFGAMRPMGLCKQLIGTPPFTAPEAYNRLTLEERTDLYSLGATAYYLLTGCHAFPARSFRELRQIWRSALLPPSAVLEKYNGISLPEIPKQLDDLVMSLLRLSPLARPANAGEVIDKLNAIAGLARDEQLDISQTYLSTPSLIGLDKEVNTLRKQMLLARVDRCGTTFIEGTPGMGRSRLLETHILEGKLVGAVVVRIDASDAYSGPYGGVNAMITGLKQDLLSNINETCEPFLDQALQALPALKMLQKAEHESAAECRITHAVNTHDKEPPKEDRSRGQKALFNWLHEICKRQIIMIAVDDVHNLDEPSVAFFAYLSREIKMEKLVLSVTAESGSQSSSDVAMKIFRTAKTHICLAPMDLEQTQALFSSVFGPVPNVRLLSDRIYSICKGNPRDALQLARHLLEKGVIQYRAGAWSLPASIDPGDLPSSMSQAQTAQIERLNDVARRIVSCMAFDPDQHFSSAEILVLSGLDKPHRLKPHLDELLAAEILRIDGDRYRFLQKGFAPILRSLITEKDERALRLRLAEMFESERRDRFRMAQHLLHAGEEDRAIETLAEASEISHEHTSRDAKAYLNLTQSLPRDWYETFQMAILEAKRRNYLPKQIYELQNRFLSLSGTGIVPGSGDASHYNEIFEQLYRMTGLDIYSKLDKDQDPQTRLHRTLELVQKRYDETPERERVIEPTVAIRRLGRSLISAASAVSISYDYDFWESFPSISPLVPLSNALRIIEKIVWSIGEYLSGRNEIACEAIREILELTADSNATGIDETYRRYTRLSLMYGLGFREAEMGLQSSLSCADGIESDPSHEVNAWRIRTAYHLWQGNAEQADICAKTAEYVQIQNNTHQWYEGAHLHRYLVAYALSDDLTGVKQSIDAIELMTRMHQAWVPVLNYARGQYHRIRGEVEIALSEFECALQNAAPGRHPGWADFAGAYVTALVALGRNPEAVTEGRILLRAAQEVRLGYLLIYIQMPLALAESNLGEVQQALQNAEAVLQRVNAMGAKGLNLILAHETRALIAISMNDEENFKIHAKGFAEQLQKGVNRTLIDKYERLVFKAQEKGITRISDLSRAVRVSDVIELKITRQVVQRLRECSDQTDRYQHAIDILVKQADCLGGALYILQDGRVELVATNGDISFPHDFIKTVEADIAQELKAVALEATITATEEETLETTLTVPTDAAEMAFQESAYYKGSQGELLCPMILGHESSDDSKYQVCGEAVFVVDPDRNFKLPQFLASTLSKILCEE